jgi:hypothetical protein
MGVKVTGKKSDSVNIKVILRQTVIYAGPNLTLILFASFPYASALMVMFRTSLFALPII